MKPEKIKSNAAKLSSPYEKKTTAKRRESLVAEENLDSRLQKHVDKAINSNTKSYGELGVYPLSHFLNGDDTSDESSNPTLSPTRHTKYCQLAPTMSCKRVVEETNESTFPLLADELSLNIFKWLPKSTLVNCARVCKHWKRLVFDESLWQQVNLENRRILSGAVEHILRKGVKALSLNRSTFHPPAFNSVPQSSKLEYLDLSSAEIDVISVNQILKRCLKLKKLSLETCPLDDDVCSSIGANSNLIALNLSSCEGLTRYGIGSILRGCSELTDLNLAYMKLDHIILNSAVNQLTKNIKRLNMSGYKLLTDEVVRRITMRCTEIEELDLSDSLNITKNIFICLKYSTKLCSLALSHCPKLKEIHELYCLSDLPNLQHLQIFGLFDESKVQELKLILSNVLINGCLISTIARPTTNFWGMGMDAGQIDLI